MKSFISTPIRCSLLLLVSTLLISGCHSSSDSSSFGSQSNGDGGNVVDDTIGGENTMEDVGATTDASGTEAPSTTRVNFVITVPVYVSNALQVRLVWGSADIIAMWNRDELWTASVDFPANTENELAVTFSDGNGAITLGSFETSYKTGTSVSETYQITANQFDTDRWDSDGDGQSNLSEAIAGTNPQSSDAFEPVQASLELVQDKTFRISWQQSEVVQFYRVFENPDGTSGFTDISGDLNATTTIFDHRVPLYARVNAEYLVQSCNNQGCVDSEPVMVMGTLDNAIGYFKASNTDFRDRFGHAVSLSANGNTLAVGAMFESSAAIGINGNQDDNSTTDSGAVYLFVRNGDTWQQQAYIKASNTEANDFFGEVISLSADGNTLAVGAAKEQSAATGINGNQDDNSSTDSGAVYVFVRNGEIWHQQAYVKASNTEAQDLFGSAVSLSADGNTLAVGARFESSGAIGINGNQGDDSARLSGAVYVFVRNGEIWQQQAYVKASNTGSNDRFGGVVRLSADANTLAVGAHREDSAATGINGDQNNNSARSSGAVYVFIRNGETWQQQAYMKASNPDEGDFFGRDISLSADGNTLAVGAAEEGSAATGINGDQNDNSASESGAVYVFVRNGRIWQQQAYVKASNTEFRDRFGGAVNLSADGNTLAIGATEEGSAATGINGDQNDNSAQLSGVVYVFVRNSETWQQHAYVKASNTELGGDRFGRAVSLSADGNTLAVGAVQESSGATGINGDQSDNSKPGSGAVNLY